MDSICKEFDRVRKRQKVAYNSLSTLLKDAIDAVQNAQNDWKPDVMASTAENLKTMTTSAMKAQKEYGGTISKLSKAVDKVFNSDIMKANRQDFCKGNEPVLERTVVDHLSQSGDINIAENLLKESMSDITINKREVYVELQELLKALNEKDVLPSITWCVRNRDKLKAIGSNLEFKLRSLQFINLLQSASRSASLKYAQDHFVIFGQSHIKEIQRLMSCFLFRNNLESSTYADLVDPVRWFEVHELLVKDCSRISDMPVETPLEVCINSGCIALPKLLKVATILQNKDTKGLLTSSDELPVEVNLGTKRLYHSVFACAVSRETATKTNPPMRLPCGHAICSDSIRKIAKGPRRKFKCTYCPSEQTIADARQIYF
eukprot:m.88801 g.88801  ORF g.88801 m.88801 type:complete len:375 (+) comp13189_c0_seq2:84-1208(+)